MLYDIAFALLSQPATPGFNFANRRPLCVAVAHGPGGWSDRDHPGGCAACGLQPALRAGPREEEVHSAQRLLPPGDDPTSHRAPF